MNETEEKNRKCSFCGRKAGQRLFVNDQFGICDSCLWDISDAIFNDVDNRGLSVPLTNTQRKLACSFCGKTRDEVCRICIVADCHICNECLTHFIHSANKEMECRVEQIFASIPTIDDLASVPNVIASATRAGEVCHSYARLALVIGLKSDFDGFWFPLLVNSLTAAGAIQVTYLPISQMTAHGGATVGCENGIVLVEWPATRSKDFEVDIQASEALLNRMRKDGVLLRCYGWRFVKRSTGERGE